MRPYIRASAFRLVDFFDRYFRGLGSPLPQRPRGICGLVNGDDTSS